MKPITSIGGLNNINSMTNSMPKTNSLKMTLNASNNISNSSKVKSFRGEKRRSTVKSEKENKNETFQKSTGVDALVLEQELDGSWTDVKSAYSALGIS